MTAQSSRTRTLSTGHAVDLPLEVSCTFGAAVVPASRAGLAELLPQSLDPIPIAPRVGAVVLAGIQYHRVESAGADGDAFDPYDEFAVIVPSVPSGGSGSTGRPIRRLLGGDLGGYVHWLPVTTDASVALGREVWGYPKERADVTVTDGPEHLRATVTVDGQYGAGESPSGRRKRDRVLFLEVPKRRGRTRSFTTYSYTRSADDVEPDAARGTPDLVRTRTESEGPIGVGTGLGASVELGTGPVATGLREAGVREWSLATLYGTRVESRLFPGEHPSRGESERPPRGRTATADV